jgi:lysozyme family protein
MTELFNNCVSIVLKNEGGFQANPSDWGNWVNGKLIGTKFGIAARYFPDVDIVNLTEEQAKEIYYKWYWLKMNLEGIQDELSVLHIFDMGVNAGRKRSIQIAQEIVRVKKDGICGDITKNAINGYWGFKDEFITARIDYYKKIAKVRNNNIFLNGWINRVSKCYF